MKCATVQIKGVDGKPATINKEDFIEDRMELFVEGAAPKKEVVKTLDKMNRAELIVAAAAAANPAELDGSETKAQIIEKIEAANPAE